MKFLLFFFFSFSAWAALNENSCLVVDDTDSIRKVSIIALSHNFKVFNEAEDGLIAQTLWQKYKPASILLDWQMPEMDGVEFLTWLRAQEEGDKVWVVFYSATEEVPTFSGTLPPDVILRKPASLIELQIAFQFRTVRTKFLADFTPAPAFYPSFDHQDSCDASHSSTTLPDVA